MTGSPIQGSSQRSPSGLSETPETPKPLRSYSYCPSNLLRKMGTPRKRQKKPEKAPGSKKLEQESKITIFQDFFVFLARFWLFFELSCSQGREAPGTPFQFLPAFSRGRPFLTPVEGQRCLKSMIVPSYV